ncbi:MAG TPA: hypothetical protein ENL34_13700 [Chloroflexi bacterium]|nr:hypothetical protein [Chloroflexota bacterium]
MRPIGDWWVFRAPGVPGVARHPRGQQVCQIIAEGRGRGPHNVAVRFTDGHTLVTIRRDKSLRRLFAREEQLKLEV